MRPVRMVEPRVKPPAAVFAARGCVLPGVALVLCERRFVSGRRVDVMKGRIEQRDSTPLGPISLKRV